VSSAASDLVRPYQVGITRVLAAIGTRFRPRVAR